MSDAKSPQNLSMDEILATIRRIIAEDEQSSSAPVSAPGITTGNAATRGVPGSVRPVTVPSAPVSNEPVSNEPVSNERIVGEPRETAQAAAEAAGADNVLDLTDALNEDGSVRRLAPLAPGAPEPAPASLMSAPEPARASPFAERAAETMAAETMAAEARPADARPADASSKTDRAVEPAPTSPAATRSGANDGRLVSESAASAAATAFGRLAATPRARHEPPLVGDRPLDEIVRELLRPLLRTWLNENLPGIVERLVQEEIAKISARSGPG